jgi:hypothetical protein
LHSRPVPFQQRTNTSCYLAIPTHGFTVVLSVFRGTPPPKPLSCKIRFCLRAVRSGNAWAHHVRRALLLFLAKFSFALTDIIEMSPLFRSQTVHLSLSFLTNKKPCLHAVSRVRKIWFFYYLLTSGLSKFVAGTCPSYDMDPPRLNTQPWLNRL